jgi:hypothetical protein
MVKNHQHRAASRPGLKDPVLEYGQLLSFRAISPEIIGDRIGVRLGCTKMRIHPMSLSFTVKARICVQQKRSLEEADQKKNTSRARNYSHFITLPRFSILPRRNRSASAASEAFERATSTLVVTLFNSY